MRTSLADLEYASLRKTIGQRGTVRVALLPATFLAWGSMAATLVLFGDLPIATIFPLAVLIAGFEAVHALHAGVERIGRYVQVYYETSTDGPHWETTAMAVGPSLPGGGVDPLFTVIFLSATVVNLTPLLLVEPTLLELVALGALHLAFLVRLVRARLAAARQRAVELESFRAIKSQQSIP
jgi:hypothetical protein